MKRTLITILLIMGFISSYFIYNFFNKKEIVELDEVKLKDEIKIDKSKTLAIMLQNDEGEYTESESSVFPTTGYKFNSTRSGCVDVNGNIIENALTYNNETNKVNLRINRKVKCYTYFDKLYTVTYELDGGSFDVTPPVKEVAYGDTYGELPEPTKEGYTFKGWNGKNLANSDAKMGITRQTDIGNVELSAGTYIVSAILKNNSTIGVALRVLESDKTILVTSNYINNETNSVQAKFTLMDRQTIIVAVLGEITGYTVDVSYIQLEEGPVATEYEPYYITSDTKVVQSQNHTLKAIWEENS